jgi:hypothetical protein
MKTPRKYFGLDLFATLLASLLMTAAHAEIVFIAPPPAQVPPGAWVANMPGITNGNTSAGYALQRSQAWRMQNRSSNPSAQNYWLVLPGASSAYGYSYSTGQQQFDPMSDRAVNSRSHVSRANAYRMELFKR